jgi:eukaryotic-like serine/threonine-protein kinase
MILPAGFVVNGRYKIIKNLGSGGMATVYLAEDQQNSNFKVALKIFYPNIFKSAEGLNRFRSELLAVFKIPNQNIVQIYETIEEPGTFGLVMEYLDYGDLLKRIDAGKFTESQVIDVLHQVATGLKAIHTAGVVHRDIKPDNIIISHDGKIKISDFGVARILGEKAPTLSGYVVGTPRYISPEYIAFNKVDKRADLFSLGFIAFELICLNAPFPEFKAEVLNLERYSLETRSFLSDLSPQVSLGLQMIIERCLAVRPNSRYQSAEELLVDLENLKAQKPLCINTVNFFSKRKHVSEFNIRVKTKYSLTNKIATSSESKVLLYGVALCFIVLLFTQL